jgi:biotin carboxylase
MMMEMGAKRVLVVGTTTDYVDILRNRYPGRALFLTHKSLRSKAWEDAPDPADEVLADLGNPVTATKALEAHLRDHGLTLSGIACYDDESLALASSLAVRTGLPFPSEEAVWNSRSKYHSKRAWMGAKVSCPRVQTARDAQTLEAVMDRLGLPLVLKPLTGSGSELVFWCRKREEAREALRVISGNLSRHPDVRLYPEGGLPWRNLDPRQDVIAEEGFAGPEYSCDFLLNGDRARLIRLTGKIIDPHLGTGTASIYYVPDREETGIPRRDLENQLASAALALGFENGLFMADFISHRGKACFLEISPRPAGDCLPWLIAASSGVDTLGLALDVAIGKKVNLPDPDSHKPLAAVRIFSRQPGILKQISLDRLTGHSGVVDGVVYRRPGHRVTLPPGDYSSRILGHIIFQPRDRSGLAEEGAELASMVDVVMES